MHFGELRELIERLNDVNDRGSGAATEAIFRTIDEQRQEQVTAIQSNSARLEQLETSVCESGDTLLRHQTQSRNENLHESDEHLRQVDNVANGVADGFEKLEVDLKNVHNSETSTATAILESLQFADMRLRHDTIQDAHLETFEWIFRKSSSPFREWLSADKDIFWVNGKAGSGKSTLMKFLASEPRTRSLLQGWAGNSRLVLVDFYFWHLGSRMQKSEEGLLRALLYQIFDSSPELMRTAIPQRCRSQIAATKPWSLLELRQALEYIALSKKATVALHDKFQANRATVQIESRYSGDAKFCFFIDGLDEYEADHTRLVKLLQFLGNQSGIKICVSSRPWNVFRTAFGDIKQKFVLEDLTRPDIELYVRNELGMLTSDVAGLQNLVEEVATKAEGVFLWVYLTVQSLREGIAEGDSLSLLRERVEHLPSDLEDYFQLILDRVHPIYKKSKTMTALRMAVLGVREESQWDWESGTSCACTRSFLNFWILREGIDDPAFAIRQEIVYLDSERYIQYARRTQTFISAICKDLLYLKAMSDGEYKIDFLHRTVFEFLESEQMRQQINAGTTSHVQGRYFGINIALARTKFIRRPEKIFDYALALLRAGIEYLSSDCLFEHSLLAELDAFAGHSVKHIPSECAHHGLQKILSALDSLFSAKLFSYATELVRTAALIQHQWCHESILRGALGLKNETSFPLEEVNETFLQHALSFGIDANVRLKAEASSPWEMFVYKCVVSKRTTSVSDDKEVHSGRLWKLTKIFIDHGAKLNGKLQDGRPVEEALNDIVPLEHKDELQQLLARPADCTPKV